MTIDLAAADLSTATRSDGLSVTIVDVGHGNATVLRDGETTVLIDAGAASGAGAHLLEYLHSEGIDHVEQVILSHADEDHIGGLLALISARVVSIEKVLLNVDSAKSSAAWQNLAYELDNLEEAGSVQLQIGLKKGSTVSTCLRGVTIEVLAPRARLVQLGAGSRDRENRRIATNTISAVIRVCIAEEPLILLPGDLDVVGYSHLSDARLDLNAKYLVLPHHGGLGGSLSATVQMTKDLCAAVDPDEVFISNGRGGYGNPNAEVIKAVRASSRATIACTQLSKSCGARSPTAHMVTPIYGAGSQTDASCAGSIRLSLIDGATTRSGESNHLAFIDSVSTTALCRSS